MGITDMITGLIGTLLYPIFSIIFVAVDGLQSIFFAFAGIGDMQYGNGFTWDKITSGNSGMENDTGIVYYLMNSALVKNLLLSIMLLALFLIVIFTVMAFIKNVYSAKQKGWKEIIGNSIKGLANFIFLPVCCLLGVWLGNILLQAINGATSSGGAELMSRKLFIAAAYNANHYRNGMKDDTGHLKNAYNLALYEKDKLPFKESDIKEGLTQEEYATMVDQLFASPCISIYDQASVGCGYSLFQINYLVIIVGGIFMLYVLGSLCFAMVRRIFFLLMLFIISPGICAMYPLDEGKAVGSWAGEVKKLVLSAYGAVAGMNIFFSLLPIVDNIHIFGDGVLFDDLLGIFIMVSGLLVVKELISTISNLVGGEDAYAKGSSLMKATTGAMKKYGGGMAKGIAKFTGGVQGRLKAGKSGAQAFWGQVGKSAGGLGWKSLSAVTGGMVDIPGLSKDRKDALKDAKEHAWDNYDSRSKNQIAKDNQDFKFLLGLRGQGGMIPTDQIYEFLNGVKDENAKKEYERKLINKQNQLAMSKKEDKLEYNEDTDSWDVVKNRKGRAKKVRAEASLLKEGSYIENAKEYKNFEIGQQAQIEGNVKDINAANVELEALGLKGLTQEEVENAILNAIKKGNFKANGLGQGQLDPTLLQQRVKTGSLFTANEMAQADGNVQKAMIAFNEELKKKLDFDAATEKLKTANESLAASVKQAAKEIEKTAKKLNIPKPNLSALEDSLKDAAKDASTMGDELEKVFKKLKKFENIK